jgi:hypothetical protein
MLNHPDLGLCVEMQFDGVYGNPKVSFDTTNVPTNELISLDPNNILEIDPQFYNGNVEELFVNQNLADPQCSSIPTIDKRNPRFGRVVIGTYKGAYWIHDSRFILQDNTVRSVRYVFASSRHA